MHLSPRRARRRRTTSDDAPGSNGSRPTAAPYPVGMATPEKRLSPQAARAVERRETRLAEIASQVSDGSLVVRKMTAAERKRFAQRRAERPVAQRRTSR